MIHFRHIYVNQITYWAVALLKSVSFFLRRFTRQHITTTSSSLFTLIFLPSNLIVLALGSKGHVCSPTGNTGQCHGQTTIKDHRRVENVK
jgi:hypothetical protein